MYVDGFVLPVPTANREAYRAFAAEMAIAFKEHGALSVVEAWGDDVPEGKVNSMRSAVLLKEDETVVFAWIAWPDKATREAGMKAASEDPRRPLDMSAMPFDGKRMIFGGFETIVSV
jgi:uncharacterized protein YbaA (DUF1428 family)